MSQDRSAWYYHFWPWFIVGLLGVSVVGSLSTVVIAYRYGDVEVSRTAKPGNTPLRFGAPEPKSDPVER